MFKSLSLPFYIKFLSNGVILKSTTSFHCVIVLNWNCDDCVWSPAYFVGQGLRIVCLPVSPSRSSINIFENFIGTV